MRRFGFVLPVAALVLAACQDTQQPPASFQLADGRNWEPAANWNKHFFFLTPIAPTPTTFNGPFDPAAGPHLRAWITGPWPVTVDPTSGKPDALTANCSDSQFYALPAPVLGTTESYATSWHPSRDSGVEPTPDNSLAYRICVSYQAASIEIVLGWRDVLPDDGGSNQPRNTEQDPIYQFGSNGNLPIKFRVEEGILDDEFCQFDVLTGGELYDCKAKVLSSNGTATCENNTCEMTAGVLGSPTELFVVEKFGPGSAQCSEPGATTPPWLQIDNPQYAGCVLVRVPNTEFQGFVNSVGTVGACFYEGSGPTMNSVDQRESMQLHVQYPSANDTTVW
ncbi:MAG: hypothetical protein OEY20_13270, partial [Gemmatimonadota bacterium]|nr:hypothetical protein [Gemmatimonadota bacterium]